MKKKIIASLIIFMICLTTVYAMSNSFTFDSSKLSFVKNSKESEIVNSFDNSYHLETTIKDDNTEIKETIKSLTKKTTYLLFGGFDNQKETEEEFYKRYHEWDNLIYRPEVDENDTTSYDYLYSVVAGFLIQIFNQAQELDLNYKTYGDIRVTINDDKVIGTIILPYVKYKEENKDNPFEYDYITGDFVMHYYFRNLNGEWKLFYAYGSDSENLEDYYQYSFKSEVKNKMGIVPSYQSNLSSVYNFDKINKLSQNDINKIYESNKNKIVFLNSYYNNYVVGSANGFFINNGLVVTTWSYLEECLIKSQYINIKGLNNKVYELEGIVIVNPETDIAVLKVKNNNGFVNIGEHKVLNVEDPIVTINSNTGVGLLTQTGIVISNNEYLETSIPLIKENEGSPLFNTYGDVIGMNTSKLVNSSMSIAINSSVLKEIQNKFKNIKYDDIKTISFEELKEKYYYGKNNEEVVKNSIPNKYWDEFSNIGNVKDSIKLEIVKASYKDNIVSLRYKNNINNYVSSMQLSSTFRDNLIKQNYKEVINSKTKAIYENGKYKVIIMEEFDYLIVVMVKL